MNFKKVNDLKLELDKSQSEIMIENEINELFELVDSQQEMIVECYKQIVKPLMISLNLNLNEYYGYSLYFYFNGDSELCLNQDKDVIDLNETEVEMEFNSDIWNKTNQFLKDKKYEEIIKKISIFSKFPDYYLKISTCNNSFKALFYDKNVDFLKNNLIDATIDSFFYTHFKKFINIKQKEFKLDIIIQERLIRIICDNDDFTYYFPYQMATNKKEVIELFLNMKMQIEYAINIKKEEKL